MALNRITNAMIYSESKAFIGMAEELNLPVVKHKMAEHKALGMVGTVEYFSGIEKLEMSIKWNSFYPDALKQMNPAKAVKIQVRGSLESWDSTGKIAEVPVVALVTASYKDFPLGNFKQHDNVEISSSLSVYYTKLTIDGRRIMELDPIANIFYLGDEDVLANYRRNLGL